MTSPSKHVTVLAQDDEDAARLARGLRAWWRKLSPGRKFVAALIPVALGVGAAVLGALDVRSDVTEVHEMASGHESRIQAIEREQAAQKAADAERAKATAVLERKVDALGVNVDAVRTEQTKQTTKLDTILRWAVDKP